MAIEVMTWVWHHSRSKNTARLVLLAIADCARADGSHAFPSNAELREKANASERGVQQAVKELVALGELEVQYNAGPHGVNLYRIRMTPAESAPRRKRTPAESAGGRRKPRLHATPPQNLHPPAESAPPQNLLLTPAESAPGTVIGTVTEVLRTSGAHTDADADPKPAPQALADELADAFWQRHKADTAQSFLAIRGCIRTAIANGNRRDDVAWALLRLVQEGRPVSGGSLTIALKQVRATSPSRPSTTDQRVADVRVATERAKARIYGSTP